CSPPALPSFPTRRSSDLQLPLLEPTLKWIAQHAACEVKDVHLFLFASDQDQRLTLENEWQKDTAPYAEVIREHLNRQWQMQKKRSEEHTSELQSRENLVC